MAQGGVKSSIETFIVVTVIAMLIWLYAEGESVKETTDYEVTVRFTSEGQDVLIEPVDRQVLISFSASTGQVQLLDDLLKRGDGAIDIPLVDQSASTGSPLQKVVLKERLGTILQSGPGIEITQVDPAVVDVSVQQMARIRLPVEVRRPDVQLASDMTVTPPQVSVRLPASAAPAAEGEKLIARLDLVDLSGRAANTEHIIDVPLELPPSLSGQPIEWPIKSVEVRFKIERPTATHTLTTVPIHISVPPLLLKQYTIDLPPDKLVLTDVKLSGQAKAIDLIRAGEFKVWAQVVPTADDLEAQLREDAEPLPLGFHLPPGVRLESQPERVRLKVARVE